MNDTPIQRARGLLQRARRIVALTGAGISAESGVPTFRGAGGEWRGFRSDQLATPEAFARDPALVWEWYGYRRRLVAACEPNPAHDALAAVGGRVAIVTQNVDGLHGRAIAVPGQGLAPELIELHGQLFTDRCTRCTWRCARDPADSLSGAQAGAGALPPPCPRCAAPVRPAVVWFGEMLEAAALARAGQLAGQADVCLVVGTSALVHPAASIASIAHRAGAALIEVNPEPTPLSGVAVRCAGPAAQLLPLLLEDSDSP